MAYSSIVKPTDYFNTKLYSGNGSTQSITGVGFQPDWSWLKCRSAAYDHRLYDVLRGATKSLRSNTTQAEQTDASEGITSFLTDGFTVEQGSNLEYNASGQTYASWNWKANGAGSVDSSTGSISATVSANATAGFSIIKFTNPSSGNFTIPHGLGVAPDMLFFKCTSGVQSWFVLHKDLTNFTDRYLRLQTDVAEVTYSMQTQAPTSTLLYLNSGGISNANAETICYAFSGKTGYSKFGKYVGNGNNDGTFIYTGFKPAWIMTKMSSGVQTWNIFDNRRNGYNPTERNLQANLNNAEDTGRDLDILSNGFKQRNGGAEGNGNNSTYIYMAFAEEPLVANVGQSIPATAR